MTKQQELVELRKNIKEIDKKQEMIRKIVVNFDENLKKYDKYKPIDIEKLVRCIFDEAFVCNHYSYIDESVVRNMHNRIIFWKL